MGLIYVELRSGLGNQLFQYAFGYSLAEQFNRQLIICPEYYDPSWKYVLKKVLKREARAFRLPLIVDQLTIEKSCTGHVRLGQPFVIVDETKMDMSTILSVCENNDVVYLKGYWQNPELFKHVSDELRRRFNPSFHYSRKYTHTANRLTNNHVAIHVRRGDFLTNKAFGACSLDYYMEAIKKILERQPDATFIIFTNDKFWVDQVFKGRISYEIYHNPRVDRTDVEELFLMAQFNSLIISNSTFSWWSAFLSSAPPQNIYAPKKWFTNSILMTRYSNLPLHKWNIIENQLEFV